LHNYEYKVYSGKVKKRKALARYEPKSLTQVVIIFAWQVA